MRSIIFKLALVAETALVIWTAYIFYRWTVANAGPDTAYTDLIPYRGIFAAVVAPWIAAAAVIPTAMGVLAIAEKLGRRSISN